MASTSLVTGEVDKWEVAGYIDRYLKCITFTSLYCNWGEWVSEVFLPVTEVLCTCRGPINTQGGLQPRAPVHIHLGLPLNSSALSATTNVALVLEPLVKDEAPESLLKGRIKCKKDSQSQHNVGLFGDLAFKKYLKAIKAEIEGKQTIAKHLEDHSINPFYH
ncbi:hypothetical protein FIBSPDRAFT_891404 [Athelia psychrophila]|uniref:Uncharacterized protein n=1 Tax=Athelia psychrophila TaxID=1759441 RepID=A0A166JM55_9AGAM|nr:hypothetical protein FIBSPDRAFT_891404 [Fibularhizoctonia sp. CBS 109695]